MSSSFARHWINGATFLAVWLGAHIFGVSLWRFVVANVQHWWHRGAIGDILSGLLGMALFLWCNEYSRRERSEQRVRREASKQRSA